MPRLADDLAFDCPRCSAPVTERFYGPCAGCRAALGEMGGDPGSGEAEAARFEPRMHVVPNHVATKD